MIGNKNRIVNRNKNGKDQNSIDKVVIGTNLWNSLLPIRQNICFIVGLETRPGFTWEQKSSVSQEAKCESSGGTMDKWMQDVQNRGGWHK